MIRGITYSDENMTRSAMLCRESMLKNGVAECSVWCPGDIQPEFKQFNRDIFAQERGAHCYWLFKPYIIYNRMLRMEEGEILIYSDAGIEFVAPVQPIIDRMDEDIFFFDNNFPHVEWCKGDVFHSILSEVFGELYAGKAPADHQKNIYRIRQVQASSFFIRVNQKTLNFVKEWLLRCQQPGFIDDSPSRLANYPTFAEHRHDQAILTCLQVKYRYKTHWFPTTTAQHLREYHPEDVYPTMFLHHRKRNHEW